MSETQEWWQTFFPVWGEVPHHAKSEEETRAEADCIEDLLELPPQSHILDVPCGAGRLALAVAALGYRVTGVDITLPLLEEARRQQPSNRSPCGKTHPLLALSLALLAISISLCLLSISASLFPRTVSR